MLERVRLRDTEKGVDVEAFTDGYACDEYSCLYLLSVAGRDSVPVGYKHLKTNKRFCPDCGGALWLAAGDGARRDWY